MPDRARLTALAGGAILVSAAVAMVGVILLDSSATLGGVMLAVGGFVFVLGWIVFGLTLGHRDG
jgi:hypothetical protein